MSDGDDLYGLPRADFVPARRELAKRLRADGDREAATRVEKLPKPTTAAWLVNHLVRAEPARVDALVELGADLRAAHAKADGARLRELARRRTEVVAELVAAAGEGLSEATVRELEEMFTTAVADEGAAEVLRAGRVASVRDLRVEQTWPGLSLAPGPAAAPTRSARPSAREALLAAKAAVKEAEAQRAEADRAVSGAESAVSQAETRVRELNVALDEAEHAELDARRALQSARRDAKAAERTASLAWRKLQQVEAE
ncbi:hypothetical protein [Actinokineospora globicatena]|uniref:Uncharacterized protein n=1 Tax=Actinokineospora globicatena TaxID=103729 RepID=A0A9W6QH54_9PSEU|nr:hypothetical protein [Actinokineospora globicatena]MCP2304300.1 hypothetical protein [Actinokineospora globicatena]GLW78338.1 hypothetical protein Aglo01_28200 [Actinokineospora globicatena]GLW84998.1 hypothetical protein Aglo02_26380 [Actinokineospora globicatena]GLW90946.1 hypothetical protein Aglo03_17620 [Actinokineospora globicatena]